MDENICEVCGTRNEPGAQFCVECQSFLPWEDTRETDLAAVGVTDVLPDDAVVSADSAPTDSAPTDSAPTDSVPTGEGPIVADPGSKVTADMVPGEGVSTSPGPADSVPTGPVPTGPVPADSVTAGPATAVAGDAVVADARQSNSSMVDPRPAITIPRHRSGREDAEALRITVEPVAVEVVPDGDEAAIEVQIINLSPIVDAFRATVPDAPDWLVTSTTEVRLLPNSNESTRITLRIPGGRLVPAGNSQVTLRVQSIAHAEIFVEQHIDLTVPALESALVLRLDPSIVRVKDHQAGRFQATIDNSAGNTARRVVLAGRDPESIVQFFFAPGVLDVPAGGTASAAVRVEAPSPEPGDQATRQLTVSATDGDDVVESLVTFLHSASVVVPMELRVEPSLVRVRDTVTGQLDIIVDNRKGGRTRRVFLGGRDPERIVHFAFSPPSIDVFAGEVGRARLRIEAPQPPPGQDATRTLTIIASSEGTPDLEVTATFVQGTSAAPVDTPVTIRLDPSVVRVRDTAVGQLEAIIDNRGGSRVRRIFLNGRDPERLVRFTFSPPSLDVLPGDLGRVRVRLEGPLPDPGQETTRQVTVIGADGSREIEAGGTFVQVTSPTPVETPVALKLEPSLIRARDTTSAQFQVIVDNRQGIRPRRVTLAGTDPERAVGFSFWPPVVEVGQGQIARATGRLDAYPPEPGRDVTRQFSVSASDGAKEVEADGTFIQSTSPAAPDEPMTVRLDPSVIRVRNSSGGVATVVADNRGGSRPRRVQFAGHDPERVVRFAFSPPVLELAPGQAAGAQVRISAPRPDGGEEVNRPFTVVASDGVRDTDVAGNFVQESTDRRPMWRILLTVLGGLMMIAGAFLVWNQGASFVIPSDVGDQVSPNITGLEWSLPAIDVASEGVAPGVLFIDLPDRLDPLVSAGAVIIVLAALAMLGLTGSTGRLTRLAALVAAIGLVAFMVAVGLQPETGRPGTGVFVIFAGCVIAFVGGLFAKPGKG